MARRVHANTIVSSRLHERWHMQLNIRSDEVNLLAEKLASRTHLTKTAAVKLARENKLRRLDEAGLDRIYAEEVPETGLGAAIMERLRKAAHRET